MKKWIALFLVLLVSVSFAGCTEKTMTQYDVAKVTGYWSDNVYYNNFSNFKYTLPENWVAATKEEVLEVMGIDPELLKDQRAYLNELTKTATVYDFFVQKKEDMHNIAIMFENLELSFLGTAYDAEGYVKELSENLKNEGFTVAESSTITIADKQYVSLPISGTQSGVKSWQSYYVRKVENFMVVILVTSFDENQAPNSLLEGFTYYDVLEQ